MDNWQIDLALTYHDETKHTYERLQQEHYFLDWGNQPQPFKTYRTLAPLPLPPTWSAAALPALQALAPLDPSLARRDPPTLADLAALLFAAAGITRRRMFPGYGEMLFRAAACTGALYHIDLYVVTDGLPDLSAGVYHFDPRDQALRQLRAGAYRQVLVEASGGNPTLQEAPVCLIAGDTFWRNTWKYRARAYRHSFWDTGTMLANLLATATARHLRAHLALGFVDAPVNALLGLEMPREAALCLVGVGAEAGAPAPLLPALRWGEDGEGISLPPLDLEVAPLSAEEQLYAAISLIHMASAFEHPDEAVEWRATPAGPVLPAVTGALLPLRPTPGAAMPAAPLETVIRRRGSARGFTTQPLSQTQLTTLLAAAIQPIPTDYPAQRLTDLYLLVNAVEGVPAGTYVYHPEAQALERLGTGASREDAEVLALGQELAAEASVLIFVLCDLLNVVERLGNRGYRAAQLEAGILGGRMYLGAYAQGLGATGLTFLDDEVTEYFAPHAAEKSVMFLLAVGYTARR